jgi:hypothetical protein
MDLGSTFPKICHGYFDIPDPMMLYFTYRLIFLYIEYDSRLLKRCFAAVDRLLNIN